MRQANDIIGQVSLVVAFVIMTGVPLTILTLGTLNFIRAITRRGTIVLQALTANCALDFSHLRHRNDSHRDHLLVTLSACTR